MRLRSSCHIIAAQRLLQFRRIGPTPGLSPGAVQPIAQSVTRADTRTSPMASTLPPSKDNHNLGPLTNNFTSLPAKTGTSTGFHRPTNVDEFGVHGSNTRAAHSREDSAASSEEHSGGRAAVPISTSNTTASPGRRAGSAYATGHGRRLTVTNPPPETTTQPATDQSPPVPITNTTNTSTVNRPWISAEEEKKRLYDIAKANVERVRNNEARVNTPVRFLSFMIKRELTMLIAPSADPITSDSTYSAHTISPCRPQGMAYCRRGENTTVRQSTSCSAKETSDRQPSACFDT